jgi:hypothetical protein
MNGVDTPKATAADVLAALRAAHAYCRAMEALHGRLGQTERRAMIWCLHGEGEFTEVWAVATTAEREEAGELIGAISARVEAAAKPR